MVVKSRWSLAVGLLFVAVVAPLPALAQETDETKSEDLIGRERAAEVITLNVERQVAHLTALLEEVPEQAQPGIMSGIEALTQGMQAALDAIGVPQSTSDTEEATDTSGDAAGSTGVAGVEEEEGAVPETTGDPDPLAGQRAADAIGAGTSRAESALTEAMSGASDQAQAALAGALDRITQARDRVLAVLASTEVSSPELSSAGIPTLPAPPERPGRPERAERVDVPERPVPPERPERPERPDVPGRP